MYQLEIRHKFDASHQLQDSALLIFKGCARLHGHTYAVRVFVSAKRLNEAGMIIDFKAVKNVIDIFDHQHINDVFAENEYAQYEPTAERIAQFIFEKIETTLNLVVDRVMLCEGYKGDEFSSWAIYQREA